MVHSLRVSTSQVESADKGAIERVARQASNYFPHASGSFRGSVFRGRLLCLTLSLTVLVYLDLSVYVCLDNLGVSRSVLIYLGLA